MRTLAEAFTYAADLHATQTRKGSDIPYLSHLMSVAALVLEHGGGTEQAIAALLHDAAEDQGGQVTLDAIRDRFGDEVANIVLACTDSLSDDPAAKAPWRERKETYLAHLAEAEGPALLVSLADKTHNARSIVTDLRAEGVATLERFTGKADGTVWYYESLLEIYRTKDLPNKLLGEFARSVEEMGLLTQHEGG